MKIVDLAVVDVLNELVKKIAESWGGGCGIIKGVIALGYQFLCWGLALTAEVQE